MTRNISQTRFKINFQACHNIRIALLGGQHRTAMVVHMFTGHEVQSAQPDFKTYCFYNITENSNVLSRIFTHVLVPKSVVLTPDFIQQPMITVKLFMTEKNWNSILHERRKSFFNRPEVCRI